MTCIWNIKIGFNMKDTFYLVVCETIDPETEDVLDWFDVMSFDTDYEAIAWAEQHVDDYVASEDEQLSVLEIEEVDRVRNYEDAQLIWYSRM